MPLYEITNEAFRSIDETSLADMKLRERGDLQRLLRTQIDVLADDLYVVAEEFGEWEDSRRRIDLLAIDKNANLVVIELKRTTDGGHMELQAIRYASMVSTMTFTRAVEIHADYLAQTGGKGEEAQNRLLDFLGLDEPNEETFAADVRIILVSEDFGKELTSAVLWLREHEIDVSCVRLKPYQNGPAKLVDVQQIIPLPEANDYQVQVREKEQQGKKERAARYDERLRFWKGLVAVARSHKTRHANLKPGSYSWLGARTGIRGLGLNYVTVQESSSIELYIDRGNETENKKIFDQIYAQREKVEAAFGGKLSWERLDGRRASRIKYFIDLGGYRTAESQWPEVHAAMVGAMTKFEAALQPELDSLGL
jgi:hypothetical protein